MDNRLVLLRLILAMVMGAIIGIERASRKSTAGLRTFSLVCIGAALTMIINEYLMKVYGTGDPARLSAQVISGIGFLGMGSIIVTSRNQIKGLTTAAALWTTAVLGLAVGAGMVLPSIISFFLIIIVVHLFYYASHHLESYNRMITIYVEVSRENGMHSVMQNISEQHFEVISLEKKKLYPEQENIIAMQIDIDMKEKSNHSDVVTSFMHLEEVKYVEEVKKL